MTKFRKGDVVNIRAEVLHHSGGASYVEAKAQIEGPTLYARPECVTLIHHGFKTGDIVQAEDYSTPATIVAIDGDLAWCRWNKDLLGYETFELCELRHIDAPMQQAAE